jgi:hypothetical protein
MKRPAFQFYPADWRKDSALQSCSIGAQGLWMNMLCIAHECDPYGHLAVNGKPMQPAQIGRLVGLSERECRALLDELENAGVFSKKEDGTIFSRRMVADERLRNIRAESGRLGGNPNLLGGKVNQNGNQTSNQDTNQPDKQSPTPSSSSSSSSSNSKESRSPQRGSRLTLPDLPEPWKAYCRETRPDLKPESVWENFRDFWVAKPGKDGLKLDWEATWRTWVRRESLGKPLQSVPQAMLPSCHVCKKAINPGDNWLMKNNGRIHDACDRVSQEAA